MRRKDEVKSQLSNFRFGILLCLLFWGESRINFSNLSRGCSSVVEGECNSIQNASKWLFKEHTTELMPIAITLKLLWDYFLVACKHLIGYYVNTYKACFCTNS